MTNPIDFSEPTNAWFLLYKQSALYQFLGLLVEMNASAKAVTVRYELLKYGAPDGPERVFSFDKEQNMQHYALEGIGAALIIGTDSLLKAVHANPNSSTRNGPEISYLVFISA